MPTQNDQNSWCGALEKAAEFQHAASETYDPLITIYNIRVTLNCSKDTKYIEKIKAHRQAKANMATLNRNGCSNRNKHLLAMYV